MQIINILLYICAGVLLLLCIAVITRIMTGLPKLRKHNERNFDHEVFHNKGK